MRRIVSSLVIKAIERFPKGLDLNPTKLFLSYIKYAYAIWYTFNVLNISSFPARQFSVRLGDVDLARDDEPSRPVTLRVTAVRAHDKFSRVGYYNDIAVLVLSGEYYYCFFIIFYLIYILSVIIFLLSFF